MSRLAQVILFGFGILLLYFSSLESEEGGTTFWLRLIGFGFIGMAFLFNMYTF